MRRVKTDPKLSTLGENVTKIWRIIKGELLLQLGKNDDLTEDFREAIGEHLEESASVRSLKERRTIEIKDINEITEKEDVCDKRCSYHPKGG